MAKISKGKVILSNAGISVILIEEERGTLIQNCGYTDNGRHVLSLPEALFLSRAGLLILESESSLEKMCCELYGVHGVSQSMSLFDFGLKNNICDGSGNRGSLVFNSGKQHGRVANSRDRDAKTICPVLPDGDFFSWLSSYCAVTVDSTEEVYVYLQLPQTCAYFQVKRIEVSFER